jgi:hypothetical protein
MIAAFKILKIAVKIVTVIVIYTVPFIKGIIDLVKTIRKYNVQKR